MAFDLRDHWTDRHLDVHTASLCTALQAVMAIGDGGNDLPLLQSVGLGIAMGNAVPQVRAHA